jgi:hypothetical protein
MAFVLIIGKAERFPCWKQAASYLDLVPLEDSQPEATTEHRELSGCSAPLQRSSNW